MGASHASAFGSDAFAEGLTAAGFTPPFRQADPFIRRFTHKEIMADLTNDLENQLGVRKGLAGAWEQAQAAAK